MTASVNCPPEWIDVDGGSGGGDAAPIAVGYISGFTGKVLPSTKTSTKLHFITLLNAKLLLLFAWKASAAAAN